MLNMLEAIKEFYILIFSDVRRLFLFFYPSCFSFHSKSDRNQKNEMCNLQGFFELLIFQNSLYTKILRNQSEILLCVKF